MKTLFLAVLLAGTCFAQGQFPDGYDRSYAAHPFRLIAGRTYDLRPMIQAQDVILITRDRLYRAEQSSGGSAQVSGLRSRLKAAKAARAAVEVYFVETAPPNYAPTVRTSVAGGKEGWQRELGEPVVVRNVPAHMHGKEILAIPMGFVTDNGVKIRLYDYGTPLVRGLRRPPSKEAGK